MENLKFKTLGHYILVGTLSAALLSACTPVIIERNDDSGYYAVQGTGVNVVANDMTIKGQIKNQLAKDNLFTLVGVKVSEGRVLLTGKVPTQTDRLEASKIAWLQPGVREVNNEIIVTRNTAKSAQQLATDSLITSELKSKLLVTKNVNSLNYGFETIDGVVYVLGVAQNQRELNKVLDVAISIKGVKKVVSYVRVRS